jgi:hypothetical protein
MFCVEHRCGAGVEVAASQGRLSMRFYRPSPFACYLFFCNHGRYKPNEVLSRPDARCLTLWHACFIFDCECVVSYIR